MGFYFVIRVEQKIYDMQCVVLGIMYCMFCENFYYVKVGIVCESGDLVRKWVGFFKFICLFLYL